jgi:hypothetical protein
MLQRRRYFTEMASTSGLGGMTTRAIADYAEVKSTGRKGEVEFTRLT